MCIESLISFSERIDGIHTGGGKKKQVEIKKKKANNK